MTRVKRGVTSRKKHKKVLKLTKGYRMTNRRLIKRAKEASLHAGEYAFHGRKLRKRDMRQLWITRINSQLAHTDLSYNRFINGLKKANIEIDRKMLSHLALHHPEIFKVIVQNCKSHIN